MAWLMLEQSPCVADEVDTRIWAAGQPGRPACTLRDLMRRRLLLLFTVSCLLVGALVVAEMSPANAADVRDISFPQCGMKLPGANAASAGVLGANGGRAFTKNPCLVDQLRWAKQLPAAPAFYMNTGNPGPWRGTNWPTG